MAERGAGIQQSPNAMRVHRALGTEDALREVAFEPEAATVRDGRTGRVLLTRPLRGAAERRYGAPYLHLHRADLQRVLLEASRDAGLRVTLGQVATGYEQVRDRASLTFEGGGRAEADVVIAADGARSPLRRAMLGETEPDFTGMTAWRALVPADRLPRGTIPPDATSWIGPGGHVVTYYLRKGALVNLVAVRERAGWTAEGWSVPGDPEALRAAFARWDRRLGTLLEAVDEAYLWGLFARPPLPRWTDGRVALLGDAAHPMLPFMAQGAAMAVEDAWVLAACLSGDTAAPLALRAYERQRRGRTARVQALSTANASMFHPSGIAGAVTRSKYRAARLAPGLADARLDPVYGCDVTGQASGA